MRSLPANMRPLALLASLLAILSQVICQTNNHAIEKRHVSVLARLGELPFSPGKRYVAALAKNGELTSYLRPAWNKKYQETVEDLDDEDEYEKRYIGSLARTGELRARSSEEKRSGVEGLVRGLATGEELKRLRLEALKEELYRERKEEQQAYIDPDENRSASFGYASEEETSSDDEDDESPEKRGGISSLLRNGYGFPKRTVDEEIERLMSDVYAVDDKRNVASLARGSLFPMAFAYPRRIEEEKRNIPSLLRDRASPLGEGKRHIGSFVRNYGMPFADKRNIVSLAKNKDFPYMYMPGKRDSSSDESDETELSKRYVAALLRQGRLPVGEDSSHQDDGKDISLTQDDSKEESNERKKKSIEEPASKENTRTKREAFDDMFGAFGPVRDKQSNDWASLINKKFFGSLVKNGWLPEMTPVNNKRHIGSLARLGWLPTLRNARSYVSPRSVRSPCKRSASSSHLSSNHALTIGARGGGKIPGGRFQAVIGRQTGRRKHLGGRRGHQWN